MSNADIDAILSGGNSRRRWLLPSVAVVVVVVAAVVAFLLTRSDGSDVVIEPERAEAVMGRLTTEVGLSGSALPERDAELSFEVAGVVASVAVEEGDEVREGEALAVLVDSDARRRVETSEVQLRLAQLRLESLLADPEESAIASANQAIVNAKSQVMNAELVLEQLLEPPNAADLASAEQAVANALGQLSSAEQALEALSESPGAADLASAEQAVANALGQLSSAEQALDELSEPPSAADLASAEQAMANAQGQLSSAEEDLAGLIAGPSAADLSESRSEVTQAQVLLADATRLEEDFELALTEEFDEFCERFSGLIFSDAVITSTCRGTLPMSDTLMADMRESFEEVDVSATYEELGNLLIEANVAFVVSAANRSSALSAFTKAEESLKELMDPVSEDDLYQAEQAVEAANASHSSAGARLEDLQALPGKDDVYQAERAVEAARSNRTAAVARLDELREAASEEEVFQAEQALEAAQASHTASAARLQELLSADEDDLEQARASLESALAGLASAQANYDELVSGPTENAIEQEEQDVRLAELSVEEAREALAELRVVAPFDGVVEAVNIHPGDRITSGFAAFTLSTSSRMLISLTVTEEELLDLEVGQPGLATFEAIEGSEYPVTVSSISRVPNAEQGVVTYDVEARIPIGDEKADRAGAGSATSFRPGVRGAGGRAGGPFGDFELPEGVSIQQVRQMVASIELPEGVTMQQVLPALASGAPLPEGVVLPEELRELMQASRSPAEDESQVEGEQSSPAPGPSAESVVRPLPAPGMSASVTILTEVREESVLVPVSAVRQLDGDWFVSVPGSAEGGFERVFVEVGESDGESVEIESGIEAGTTVLIGADGAGIAFSATQRLLQANPGFGPGQGGFGPGGAGGRR